MIHWTDIPFMNSSIILSLLASDTVLRSQRKQRIPALRRACIHLRNIHLSLLLICTFANLAKTTEQPSDPILSDTVPIAYI